MQWLIIYHSEIEWTIWRIPIYCFHATDGIFTCLLAAWGLWGPNCLWRSGMLKRLSREGLPLPHGITPRPDFLQIRASPQWWPGCLLLRGSDSPLLHTEFCLPARILSQVTWKGLGKTLTWTLLTLVGPDFSSMRFLCNLKLFRHKGLFTVISTKWHLPGTSGPGKGHRSCHFGFHIGHSYNLFLLGRVAWSAAKLARMLQNKILGVPTVPRTLC